MKPGGIDYAVATAVLAVAGAIAGPNYFRNKADARVFDGRPELREQASSISNALARGALKDGETIEVTLMDKDSAKSAFSRPRPLILQSYDAIASRSKTVSAVDRILDRKTTEVTGDPKPVDIIRDLVGKIKPGEWLEFKIRDGDGNETIKFDIPHDDREAALARLDQQTRAPAASTAR